MARTAVARWQPTLVRFFPDTPLVSEASNIVEARLYRMSYPFLSHCPSVLAILMHADGESVITQITM